jgi:hypothetical protein
MEEAVHLRLIETRPTSELIMRVHVVGSDESAVWDHLC